MDRLALAEQNVKSPVKLMKKDLAKLHINIAGYDFLNLSGVLACPECGQPQRITCHELPNKEIVFFLQFYCLHYKK